MTDAERIAAGLSKAQQRALLKVPTEGAMTKAECGASGMALTLLCCLTPPLLGRRWKKWGGEPEQKHGEGYEYFMIPLGLAVRALLMKGEG